MALCFYTECFETWDGTEGGKGALDDNQWQFYDVSSNHNIPPSAVLEVACVNEYNIAEYNIGLRNTSSSGQADGYRCIQLAEAEDGDNYVTMHVQLDSSGWLQYFVQHFDRLHFDILGYWLGCEYTDAFVEFNPSATSGWEKYALDQHGVGSGQTAEIIMSNTADATDHLLGVRASGSTIDRRFGIKEAEAGGEECLSFLVSPSGATAGIDIWSSNLTDCSFKLVGYFSIPPASYVETDVVFPTPETQGSWVELDVGASGIPSDVVAQFGIGQDYADGITVGVRETNSTQSRQLQLDKQDVDLVAPSWGSIHGNVDASGKLEYYCNDISDAPSYYIMGYWTDFVESPSPFPKNDSMNCFIEGLNLFAHYIENFTIDWSPIVTSGQWQTISMWKHNYRPNTVAEVLMGQHNSTIASVRGVRSSNSDLLRRFVLRDSWDSTTEADFVTWHVPLDNNSEFECLTSGNASMDNSYGLGYWKGCNYVELFELFTVVISDNWINQDLISYGVPSGKIAEIIIQSMNPTTQESGGVRQVGSALHRAIEINGIWSHTEPNPGGVDVVSMLVNTSGDNSTIQAYAGDYKKVKFVVVGYWDTAPGDYTELITPMTPISTQSVWRCVDLYTDYSIPSGAIADICLGNYKYNGQNNLGVREIDPQLSPTDSQNRSVPDRQMPVRETNETDSFGFGVDAIKMHVNTISGCAEFYHSAVNADTRIWAFGYWDNFRLIPFEINNQKNLFIHGYTQYDILDEVDYPSGLLFYVEGIPNNQSGEITLYTFGVPGFISTSGDQGGLYPSGVSLYTYGIHGEEHDLHVFGHEYEEASGLLYINGIEGANSNENPQYPSGLTLFADGSGIIPYSEQHNLFIYGCTSHLVSGDMFTEGVDLGIGSGDLFLKSPEPQTASFNLIVYCPLDAGPGLLREENAVFYVQTYDDSGAIDELVEGIEWYVPGIYFYDREFIGSYYETETAGDGTLPFYNSLGKGFAANQFGTSFIGDQIRQQNILGRVAYDPSCPNHEASYPYAGLNNITTAFWMSGSQVPASSQVSPGGGIQTASGTRIHVGWFHRSGKFRPGLSPIAYNELGPVIPCHMLGLETRGASGLVVRTSVRDVPYNQPSGGGLWWGGTTHYGKPSGPDWTWNDQVSGIYYSWEEEWPEIQLARENITFFVLHADFVSSGNGLPNHMKVYLSADGQPWIFIGSGVTGPPASSLYSYDDPHNRYAENAVGFHVVTNNWSGGFYGTNVGLAEIALWSDANKFTEDELYDLYHVVQTYQRPMNEYRPTIDPPPTYITRTVGLFAYDPTIPGVGYNPGEICSGILVTIEVGLGAYGEDASAYLLEETPPSGFYIRNISPEYTRYLHQGNRPHGGQSQLNDPQSGIMEPYNILTGNIYNSTIRWVNHDNHPEHDQRRSVRPTKTYTYELYPFHFYGIPRIDAFALTGSGVFFGGSTGSGVFTVITTGDTSGTTSGLTGGRVNMGCDLYINGPVQISGTANLYIRTTEGFTSAYIGNSQRTPEITDFIYAADGFAALDTMAGIEYGPPLYTQGPLQYTNNCPLFIRGPEGGEADLHTWGHEPFNSSGSHPSGMFIRMDDGHIVQSGSSDLIIRGPMPSSGTLGLYTMAGVFSSVGGGAGHGISPSLYTWAFEESSGNCSFFGLGPEFICTSGDFAYPLNSGLFTYPSGGVSPALYTQGPEFICSSGDFAYPGDPNAFTYPSGGQSPNLYILPCDNKNTWCTLFIGQPIVRQNWTLYLKTVDNDINNSANLFINGWQPASGSSGVSQSFDSANLYLEAIDADYPYIVGGTGNWTLFLQTQSGNLSSDDAWTLFLQADTTTSGSIGFYTYGHGVGESPHGIETSGSVGLVCSVDPEDRWRIGYTPVNSDSDPWTLFLKGVPGHFGTTTFYISGSVPTLFIASGNLFVRGLFEQETGIAPLYLVGVSGLFNNGPSGLHLFLNAGNQVYNTSRNLYLKGY